MPEASSSRPQRMSDADWDRRYATSDLIWTAEPNRFVVEQVADLVPSTAVDVACGEGRNAVWLARQGWEVTGVDFSAVALEKAGRLADHAGVRIGFTRADLTDWTPTVTFDLVVVAYLQLPAAERARVLATAAGALAPGGVMIVVGHDLENLTNGVGGPQDPDVLMTPDAVATELAPLVIEIAERRTRPTADGIAIDTLVRARRPAWP